MSEKKLRKRAEEAELKDIGLRETAPEEHVPEDVPQDFVQEELQIRLPGRTLDAREGGAYSVAGAGTLTEPV